jgi:hypothetical protein
MGGMRAAMVVGGAAIAALAVGLVVLQQRKQEAAEKAAVLQAAIAGIRGEMESKQTQVQVPCVEMWGDSCPILAEVRGWFKDKSLEDMGRKYWKKRSYIMQGFVRENPLTDDKAPENPIRRFIIGPQIFQIIKASLMDPDLEELPTDLMRGLDFRITKTSKGGYADYSTSKWARKESALTEQEQAALTQHGLFDLAGFLPKRPTDVELKVMKEMFEASVDGQPFDAERWGQYFRPAGMTAPAGSAAAAHRDVENDSASKPVPAAKPAASQFDEDEPPFEPAAAPVAKPAASQFDEDEPPFEPAAAPVAKPAAGTQKAEDILAMIRARQNKSQ